MVEQGAVDPILERRGVAGLNGQRSRPCQADPALTASRTASSEICVTPPCGTAFIGCRVNRLPSLAAQLLADYPGDADLRDLDHCRIVFDCRPAPLSSSQAASAAAQYRPRQTRRRPSPIGSTGGTSITKSGFSSSCLGGGGGRSSVSSNRSSIKTPVRFFALKMSHSHWCSSLG